MFSNTDVFNFITLNQLISVNRDLKKVRFKSHGRKPEHFPCQDGGLSQVFKLIVSASEKTLENINMMV